MPLRIEDGDGVRLLTWDRPEARNALNDELWDATRDALLDACADDTLRCIVLTGAGGAFTAGQDLGEMLEQPAHPDGGEHHGYRAFIPVLEELDKPLLAAVDGVAVGIGATILPHCDLVWVSDRARIKAPFLTLGVTTEAAGSLLLAQRMGWQAAAHLIFTADWLSADDAVGCGLAWRMVPAERLLDDVMATARRIGEMPVRSVQVTKRLMVRARLDAVRTARQREDEAFATLVGSPDNAAALAQFLG